MVSCLEASWGSCLPGSADGLVHGLKLNRIERQKWAADAMNLVRVVYAVNVMSKAWIFDWYKQFLDDRKNFDGKVCSERLPMPQTDENVTKDKNFQSQMTICMLGCQRKKLVCQKLWFMEFWNEICRGKKCVPKRSPKYWLATRPTPRVARMLGDWRPFLWQSSEWWWNKDFWI